MSSPRYLVFLFAATAAAQQQNVLDVGTQSQLFVDTYLVAESHGIAFTPHPARKREKPVMVADRPWEGWYVSAYCGTVLYDREARRFQMWHYAAGNPEWFDHGHTCYAVSADGKRIFVNSSANAKPSPINVVFDWTAGLKN